VLSRRRPSRPFLAALTGLATLFSVVALVAPAQAAIPTPPTGLSPTGAQSISGIPTLSWARSTGATGYDIQVSPNSNFTPLTWQGSTVNHQAVPTTQVPTGVDFWRVRARNNFGTSDWTVDSFTRTSVAPPTLVSPLGATLKEPDNPPVLKWNPVSGSTSYTVQVSTDQTFADQTAISTFTTKVSSAVVPSLQIPTVYYWRVQAQLDQGLTTQWSDPASYTLQGLSAPTLVGPTNSPDAYVQDVVLDWSAVPGAATYDIQISTDANFLTFADTQTGIDGTSYSPPTTLNNDQYFWRVRPVDASGNKLDWGDVAVWQFGRNWPDQPNLQYPPDNATVSDPFYYQWSPVHHASSYIVQLSTVADFSSIVASCSTVDTTLVPSQTGNRNCMPSDATTYWWRVVAVDGPRPVQSDAIVANVRKFTYAAPSATLTSPANGASVSVPTLRWQPVAGAAQYKVSYADTAGGGTVSVNTSALSYTPTTLLTVGHTYRWQVQTVTGDNKVSASLLAGSQRTFLVVAQATPIASTPEPTNSPTNQQRFPTLTWTPVVNADNYKLYVRPSGGSGFTQIGGTFAYPAGEDTSTQFLSTGSYDWFVEAYTGGTFLSDSNTLGSFSIGGLTFPTNGRAAITGNAITGNAGTTVDSCAATLPNTCQNLRQEPVLMWDADPNVAFYKLTFSNDGEMTNLVPGYTNITVYGNMFADFDALPDSQAGSAYYWEAVPCRANGSCSPIGHATYAFNKKSNQIVLHPAVSNTPGSCAQPSDVCNDVTLSWNDFLDTEQNPGSVAAGQTVLSTPATTGPYYYHVQTSSDPNFQTTIDDLTVDQTSFTSFSHTYPEGPIYWRVQAYDGAAPPNPLAWSDTGTFTKSTPAPTQTSPSSGATTTGTQPFTWAAQKFARTYDFEVYANNDTTGQPANRVIQAQGLLQAAYSPSVPLPASITPYTWRVRRHDAENRTGAWSPLTPFTVSGTPPTLISPVDGAGVAPSDGIFSWGAVDQAASYRFERQLAGSSNITESVTTPALAYAPTAAIDGGSWQWRVTALDPSGQPIASSAWRNFTVIDHPIAVTPVTISGSGAVGTALTAQPPGWNVPGVTTTYQWMRGNNPISAATGLLYTVTTSDVGQNLTVVATGTVDGYKNGTSQSNIIIGGAGNAPSPTVLPSISGTHNVGDTVTANPGTWPGSPQYTYQWLRGGVPITGASASSYRLGIADAARQVSVKVGATITGYAPATATSQPIKVAKMLSSTVIALYATTIHRSAHGKVSVSISVPNVAKPTGKFKVFKGKKVLMTVTLKKKNAGHKNVTLPLLPKGKYKIKVKYLGTARIAPSKSAAAVLLVTK
jgi:hypothetical protein